MCNFCKEGSEDLGQSVAFILSDSKIKITHSYDDSNGTQVEEISIKFCPMCGDDLNTTVKSQVKKTKKEEWAEDYSHIEWKKFNEKYFKCDNCGFYDTGFCICYAR